MKATVHNIRKEAVDFYIGRGSLFGNPFKIGQDGTREEVIEKYRSYFLSDESLKAQAKKHLCGKRLGCYCKPEACHGDVIAEYVNR